MTKRSIIFLLISGFLGINVSGNRLAFDSIPAFLLGNADAVIRHEQMVFKVISEGRAEYHYKFVVTLLNENSDYLRHVVIHYNKFSKIKYLNASVYNEKGKLIDVLQKVDIRDNSAISDGDLMSDDRKKEFAFPLYKYPYTIEYEYVEDYRSILNLPPWSFQDYPDISVERSSVQFIIPANFPFRYREYNMRSKIDSVITEKEKIYTWQEENLPAIKNFIYSIPFSYRFPRILTASNNFNFGGYRGNMSSWKSYGDWYNRINEGLDVIPEGEVLRVQNMVKNIENEREKIKKIYEYMQSRTRYVSIQLGIGGLQPLPATFVSEKGYGDCKALTNYMQALLKTVGINSYYTLVKSGEFKKIDTDFVCDQFDHIILCVPQKNDTIWLECTSQNIPFNYLGTFTDDRDVLLITPEGGKLAHTPKFKQEQNVISRTGNILIDPEGNSSATFNTIYSGRFYNITRKFENESDEEIKRYLNENLSFPTFDVDSVFFRENKEENPVSQLFYKISINNLAAKGFSRLYLTPVLNKQEFILKDTISVYVPSGFIDIDSIVYTFPTGYFAEYVPESVFTFNKFGGFSYSMIQENNKLIFIRKFQLNKGNYSSADFKEFYNFINSVARTDHQRVVLAKKE